MQLSKIILHCSATPNGRPHTAEDIHRWHKEPSKGYDGIGYHFVIRVDGTVDNGRPVYWAGAHAYGHNTGSIGICMIGTDDYSKEQWAALATLVKKLTGEYHTISEIIGHNEVSKKTCPGFNVQEWLEYQGIN